MVSFQKRQSFLRLFARPLFFGAALTYLVFHALNGNHGVYALLREQRRLASQQQGLESLRAERLAAEHRVMLLSDRSLDLDMLDERARKVLGYADKEEVIIVQAASPSE